MSPPKIILLCDFNKTMVWLSPPQNIKTNMKLQDPVSVVVLILWYRYCTITGG